MNHLIHLKRQDRIGWIGLGEMGYNMANNLQRYLASIHLNMIVWNRTPAKSAKMHHHGAHVAKSIEEVVAQSNIIFTSLANDAAVEEVYNRILEVAGEVNHPIIFVETSTIYPDLAVKLSKALKSKNPQHQYLQCPVFGRPPVAKAAKLIWVTSGGDEKVIKKMCLYFTTMSKSIIHLKTEDVAKACNFKLIGNFFVVGTMELLAEGLTLAEKSDVSSESVLKFIENVFPSPTWIEYSRKMIGGGAGSSAGLSSNNHGIKKSSHKEDENEGGFSVDLGLKDVGHMRQLAQDKGASVPMADVAYAHLKQVQDQGLGHQDWTSLISSLRVNSDLPTYSQLQEEGEEGREKRLSGRGNFFTDEKQHAREG